MKFTKEFIDGVLKYYGDNEDIRKMLNEGNGFIARYLSDSSDSFSYKEVLRSNSFEELKAKAKNMEKVNKLYILAISGLCYEEKDMRKRFCPVMYAQGAYDKDVLCSFPCDCYGFMSGCQEKKGDKCWEIFDKKGYKIQKKGI